MRKLLLALALFLVPIAAHAQCTGVFPAQTLCGNLTASPAPPSQFPASGTIVGPGSSTLNGLPLWANTAGTQLKDGAGLTVAGAYTWGGAQTYSALNTFNGGLTAASTANFTSTFQINGNTVTWPASTGTVPFLGSNQTFTGNNTFSTGTDNFTGTFQIGGTTLTLPVSSANGGVNPTQPTVQSFLSGSGTYTTPAGVRWIRVRAVGDGGGGSGVGATTAPTGATGAGTTFGTTLIVANGGVGGTNVIVTNSVSAGGVGGTASLGTAIGLAVSGAKGGAGYGAANTQNDGGSGRGGDSCLGGGGSGGVLVNLNNTQPAAGVTNSGGGGGGGQHTTSSGQTDGGGGGGGGCVDGIITTPLATYSYSVGGGGAGGIGTGTNPATGAAGGSGQIVVEEHYNY